MVDSASLSLNIGGVQSTKVEGPSTLFVSGFGSTNGYVQVSDASSPSVAIGNTGELNFQTGPTDLNLPFTFDDTAFVQSLVNSQVPYAGIFFQPGGSSNISVWGLTSPDPSHVPELIITYAVPEPSMLSILFGMAVFGAGWYLSHVPGTPESSPSPSSREVLALNHELVVSPRPRGHPGGHAFFSPGDQTFPGPGRSVVAHPGPDRSRCAN